MSKLISIFSLLFSFTSVMAADPTSSDVIDALSLSLPTGHYAGTLKTGQYCQISVSSIIDNWGTFQGYDIHLQNDGGINLESFAAWYAGAWDEHTQAIKKLESKNNSLSISAQNTWHDGTTNLDFTRSVSLMVKTDATTVTSVKVNGLTCGGLSRLAD